MGKCSLLEDEPTKEADLELWLLKEASSASSKLSNKTCWHRLAISAATSSVTLLCSDQSTATDGVCMPSVISSSFSSSVSSTTTGNFRPTPWKALGGRELAAWMVFRTESARFVRAVWMPSKLLEVSPSRSLLKSAMSCCNLSFSLKMRVLAVVAWSNHSSLSCATSNSDAALKARVRAESGLEGPAGRDGRTGRLGCRFCGCCC
mmetsp:Transcript_102184/g.293208  ORF Transcript_102184/g.293208 Transcript_102184/m.293208 type:complete len:205 (-) Transcript_102184:257-871(-)